MKLEELTLEELKELHLALGNGGRGAHREALREQGMGTWSRCEGIKPLVLDDDDQLQDDEPVIQMRFSTTRKTG